MESQHRVLFWIGLLVKAKWLKRWKKPVKCHLYVDTLFHQAAIGTSFAGIASALFWSVVTTVRLFCSFVCAFFGSVRPLGAPKEPTAISLRQKQTKALFSSVTLGHCWVTYISCNMKVNPLFTFFTLFIVRSSVLYPLFYVFSRKAKPALPCLHPFRPFARIS